MTDSIAFPAPAGEADPAPYRKPLTPQTAALLASMAEKRTQPKNPKKSPARKPKAKSRRAPPHNAHILAHIDHRRRVFIADFLARVDAAAAGKFVPSP